MELTSTLSDNVNVTTQNSALLSALDQLKSSRTNRQKINPLNVAVISVERYLVQSNVNAKTENVSCSDVYAYDVTVSDGVWKVKCKLSSTLHNLLHRNILRSGIGVRILELAIIYDERRVGQSFVRIDNLECTSEESEVFRSAKNLDALSVWTNNDARTLSVIQKDLPLDADGKHYLSLWNNEDPYGSVWSPNCPPVDVVFDVSKICLVADLESFYFRGKLPPPLLVRIMHKSRLRYYGKPTKNIDFPYQAYFEVADQSGTMSMVLWNDLCVEWYHRLNVGTELYLYRYTVKKAYQQRTRPQMNNSLVVFRSTEISLNPETAVMSVIPPRKVQPQWCLPEVSYLFHTRSEIENLANNAVVDVIGLVTFVGRAERVRSHVNPGVPERFWTYRWVHAIDGTSDSPFVLEIFSTSQPEMFNSIHPMALLVCTQMRVCCEPGSHRYLTSSAETQIFTTGHHRNQPYQSQAKVKNFIQWLKTLKDRDMLTRCTVGGYYCYPSPQPTLTLPTDQSSESRILALEDLKKELEGLQYREHKRAIIQGHIVAVKYHTWPRSMAELTQNAPQQVEASEDAASTSSAPPSDGQAVQSEGHQTDRDTPVSSASSSNASQKRKRAQSLKRKMKRHYITRAQALSQRENPTDEPPEDEDGSEEEEEGGPERPGQVPEPISQSAVADSSLGTIPQGGTEQSLVDSPDAFWESSLTPLSTLQACEHLRAAGGLRQESVAECFCYDDKELHLRQINLHPSRWSLELYPPQHATHLPAACLGYYTLTILGLNKQTAVDALFLPIWSVKDPRAAGRSWSSHDDSLLSCLMSGHFSLPPHTSGSTDITSPTPEEMMRSAASLEQQHVVCVLDLCLLGDGKTEVMCSRVYRTSDVVSPQPSAAQQKPLAPF